MDQILFLIVLLLAYLAALLFVKYDNKRIEAECKFTKRSDSIDKYRTLSQSNNGRLEMAEGAAPRHNHFTRMTRSANQSEYAQRQNDRRREHESAAGDVGHGYANHRIQRLRIVG